MDTKTDAKPGSRRRHDLELKRQVLAECVAPGASVAKVAMFNNELPDFTSPEKP